MPARPEVHSYSVTAGRNSYFPMDMLRFAEAWPASAEDGARIELLIDTGLLDRDRRIEALPRSVEIRLSTIHPRDSYAFVQQTKRWASFGWIVVFAPDAKTGYDPVYPERRLCPI